MRTLEIVHRNLVANICRLSTNTSFGALNSAVDEPRGETAIVVLESKGRESWDALCNTRNLEIELLMLLFE